MITVLFIFFVLLASWSGAHEPKRPGRPPRGSPASQRAPRPAHHLGHALGAADVLLNGPALFPGATNQRGRTAAADRAAGRPSRLAPGDAA